MKILKRDGNRQPTKLEKRISGISTPELVNWFEVVLSNLGRSVFHNHRDVASLQEAEVAAEAALAVVRELKKRANE